MVDVLRTYDLAFSGLSLGDHRFEYEIDDRFFDCFENAEIKRGSLIANVLLVKNQRLLELEIILHGEVEVLCDRCLDLFKAPVNDMRKLYVKFGNDPSDTSDDEDIIIIPERAHKINLAQHFYEFIHLSLPVKRIHPKNESGIRGCNPEMIKKLKEYTTGSEVHTADTRWNGLKDALRNKKLNH